MMEEEVQAPHCSEERASSWWGLETKRVSPRECSCRPSGRRCGPRKKPVPPQKGPSRRVTYRLSTAYHQAITQEFRREWPYGQNQRPTQEELFKILLRVYSKYPIPQLIGIEP